MRDIPTPISLTEALYRALNSERGVVLETTDPQRLRQKLYAERKKLNDESLSSLRFAVDRMQPESRLLIIKGAPDAAPEE